MMGNTELNTVNSQECSPLTLTFRFSRAVDYARQIHVGYRKGSSVPYMNESQGTLLVSAADKL
jgi:hypothetical protein